MKITKTKPPLKARRDDDLSTILQTQTRQKTLLNFFPWLKPETKEET